MTRRQWMLWPAAGFVLRAAGKESVRGRLERGGSRRPALRTEDGRVVALEVDEASEAVLRDPRLKDEEFEVLGRYHTPDLFRVDPIHEKALFVMRGGKRLAVTYWCDVCSIRAWRPGRCQCCQEEMRVDLRDPSLGEMDLQ